jgi:hypothetical protein
MTPDVEQTCAAILADAQDQLTPHDDLDVAYDGDGYTVRCFDCDAVWTVTIQGPGDFRFVQTEIGDRSDLITTPALH